MNNKGFTLIELLSVVILLTIITFLVLPNITNMLKSKEEEIDELAFSMIESAAKLHIEDNKRFYKKIDDSKYCIRINKLVNNGYLDDRIEYDNKDITDTKSLQVTYNQGFSFEIVDNASCTGDIIGCTVVKGNGTKTGDEIECAGEQFYVIENDGTSISMLAKYNLNIGDNAYVEGVVGIQNENVLGYKSEKTTYGTLKFSLKNYWYDSDTAMYKSEYVVKPSGYYYVYDKNSNLYKYVENYEEFLKENGVSSAETRLITYEEVSELKNNQANTSWIYSNSYWLGSIMNDTSVFCVHSNGSFGVDGYGSASTYGIRPVVSILINEI